MPETAIGFLATRTWAGLRVLIQGRSYLAKSRYRGSSVLFSLTPRRGFNYLLNNIERRLKRVRLISRPYIYLIDVNNYCNLGCPLCLSGGLMEQEQVKGIKRGYMRPEQLEKALEQVGPYATNLLLYNWGEPFIHPNIEELLAIVHRHGLSTVLSTNFNVFTESMAESVIRSQLHRIIVSIDGVDQETYEKYRAGGKFQTVVDNIKLLVRKKKERGAAFPLINAQFIVMRHNQDRLEEFEKMFLEMGVDSVSFRPMSLMSQNGGAEARSLVASRPDYKPYYELDRKEFCDDLYNTFVVNYNGDAYTCCIVSLDKHLSYGNLFKDGLANIWNNDAYLYSRSIFARKDAPENAHKVMCNVCKGTQKNEELSQLF